MPDIKNIRHLSRMALEEALTSAGQPPFRIRQIYEWIWSRGAVNFEMMSNLPKELRSHLSQNYVFNHVVTEDIEIASDRTRKYLFRLFDGNIAEGVLIPSLKRNTICISSQAGCSLACSFCATGIQGFKRNLFFDEIFDQVRILNDDCMKLFGKKVSNIVFMGMGEPLLNYREVSQAIEHITAEDGLGFSPQRITVSTAGIPAQITRMGKDKVRFNLAVSLNAATDEKRSQIMPLNKKWPLAELYNSLKYFQQQTGEIITLEYILLKEFNDSLADVRSLVEFTRDLRVKINLIEYNPVEGAPFRKAPYNNLEYFKKLLEENHFIVNIRNSKGKDIAAACGQLAGRKNNPGNNSNLDIPA